VGREKRKKCNVVLFYIAKRAMVNTYCNKQWKNASFWVKFQKDQIEKLGEKYKSNFEELIT
jgi:hypothetical protein